MVRLKVFSFSYVYYQLINFNSTMVRLKVFVPGFVQVFFAHFNSTMVRLKADLRLCRDWVSEISIPLWYD